MQNAVDVDIMELLDQANLNFEDTSQSINEFLPSQTEDFVEQSRRMAQGSTNVRNNIINPVCTIIIMIRMFTVMASTQDN